MTSVLSVFQDSLDANEFTVVEKIDLPGRAESRSEIPAAFREGRVGKWLSSDGRFRDGVWLHQAKALDFVAIGNNVVVSTGTASGKSLVFQAAAFRLLDREPDACILVFYPLKALIADQFVSWQRAAKACGYSGNVVAKLDGDVLADDRKKVIEGGSILLVTPDITHAWIMSNLARPTHRKFFNRLSLIVIDEAHVFDSVFGSNFAYLFRRMVVASQMTKRGNDPKPLQLIAASATISNAAAHLEALTGLKFETVGKELDGSPRHPRQLVHVASKP